MSDVPRTGQNVSLGRWCNVLRSAYKKIQNNQKPHVKPSDEKIQRLNDEGFKWSLKALPKNDGPRKMLVFDKRFNDLMAFKAKYVLPFLCFSKW